MSKFNKLVESHPLVLVDFYADWCGPCKAMAPELVKLKNELGDKVKIVKINTEKHTSLSREYSIRSIPTLILFKDGKKVVQQAGGMRLAQLKSLLSPHL